MRRYGYKTAVLLLFALGAFGAAGATAKAAARRDEAALFPVESRIFDAVAYDSAARRLTLLFDGGIAYVYRGVPRDVYLDFTRIVNKGEYFSRRIRNVYRCEQVDGGRAWCLNR